MQYILIDTNAVLIRYAMALQNDINEKYRRYGGLLRYFQLILKLYNQCKDAYFVVFSDKCTRNFRKQISNEYKKDRSPLPLNVILQLQEIDQYIQNANLKHIYHDEYEADDLIASFIAGHKEDEHIIVTTDKDLCQLINDNVTLLNIVNGIKFDTNAVITKYDVHPTRFALYQALIGDRSDNIKGVIGIGPKKASAILKEYEQELLIAQLEHVLERIQTKYTKYDFDSVILDLRLTTLDRSITFNTSIVPLNITQLENVIQDIGNLLI